MNDYTEARPYYTAYEKRYRTAYAAGAERWGHSPDDTELYETLREWVTDNNLIGKNMIEFACGEGAGGVILSSLGCKYYGVDIAPSAIEKASESIKAFPNARVGLLDMVREPTGETFDGALDSMGFHMLVTDSDRKSYLKNAYDSLKFGAPMLFFRQSYRSEGVYKGVVHSYEEWKTISGSDYDTPSVRRVNFGNGDIEVMVPLVPARANDRDGYISELESVGFTVEKFIEMDMSSSIQYSCSFYVRKL